MSDEKKIIIGRFGSPFGVKGWVKVISYTRPVEQILDYVPWQIKVGDKWQVTRILSQKIHGSQILVHLENCQNRDNASLLTHGQIAVDKNQLPELTDDEYYWEDLIGLLVINTQNEELGRVNNLMETGSNDVLVVKGEREHLVPYIDQVIVEVDLQNKRIIVDWDKSF